MRLRRIVAVAAVTVAVSSSLAACQSNVGKAATIDGQRVTESQVGDYLTSKSAPVSISASDGSTTSVPPRSFVLQVLIQDQLFTTLLDKTPMGGPTAAQLSTLRTRYLRGGSVHSVVSKLGAKGYQGSFESKIIEVQILATLLNNAVSSGVDVNGLAKKLKFPVSVNPRYGSWNPKAFSLTSDPSAGVPDFVTLAPTPTTGS